MSLERVVAVGARHVDIGLTGAEPSVVLAGPEGNEGVRRGGLRGGASAILARRQGRAKRYGCDLGLWW